jgi:tetratricopeptide (TPR) repeat protein
MDALRAELRESPSLVPALGAVGVLTWLAVDQAGYDKTTWYPAGLILLGLLAVSLVALPTPRPSRPAAIAVALLAAYAGWSYLSITWADQKDVAWDGANRTLVYAIVLALFALWPLRPRAAAAVIGSATLAVAVVGVVTLLRADGSDTLSRFFFEGRLVEPAGYVNANVALWFAAFWPAAVLASRREIHPLLRGLFLGSACLFSGLALLGQSRGWLVALPLMVLLALVLTPGRARMLVVLGVVGAVTLAISQPLLDVYDASGGDAGLGDAVAAATRALLLATAAAILLGAAAAWLDRRIATREEMDRRADRVAGWLVGIGVLGAILAVTVTVGNPFTEARDYWNEFKEGGTTPSAGEARLTGTAATDRYDFWRVGIDMFADRPVTGYGADNFQHEYFVRGESEQQPRYPHSLEVRVLAQTGIVGALLLVAALGAAFLAAARALRGHRDLRAAVAAAALLSVAYWLVHGSLDWFWEFAGLGIIAFAALGLAVGLGDGVSPTEGRRRLGRLPVALGVLGASLAALSFGAPWLSELYVHQAGSSWRSDTDSAFHSLDRAATLNPLSPVPDLTAGTIAVRLGRLDAARDHFEAALERDRSAGYANLELGAIASEQGRRGEALRHLRRAADLNPRYNVSRDALRAVRRGQQIEAAQINRRIVRATRARIGIE